MKSIYEQDHNIRPDTEFIKGILHFLVPGNKGRLLDARRTPVQVDKYLPESGLMHIKILKFEDKGSIWELPAEEIVDFQFEKNSVKLDDSQVNKIKKTIERLDSDLNIQANSKRLKKTNEQIGEAISKVLKWIEYNSSYLHKNNTLDLNLKVGPMDLQADFAKYMQIHKLKDLDYRISQTWASQSGGEIIKALQQTMAEMGLLNYYGKSLRDKSILKTIGTQTFMNYVIHRLAFVRSFFSKIGINRLTLYRGMSSEKGWRPKSKPWSSWTPILQIANCHADFEVCGVHQNKSTDSYLFKRTLPIEKIFMTYFETMGLNQQWKETEVIVIHDESDRKFI